MSPEADPSEPITSSGENWLDAVHFDAQGLIPAIAQDATTQAVLMVAWMNRESLCATVASGQAVYWSRSRQRLWRKGEESGHTQRVLEIRMDCDADVLLLQVEQKGDIACHTGRPSCFYQRLDSDRWTITEAPRIDPKTLYR